MAKDYEMEIVRKIYDNGNGYFMSVGPSADFPGNVMLYTTPENHAYFGPQRLDLPWQMMKMLGEALIAASAEAEKLGD